MCALLGRWGVTTLTAETPADALAQLRQADVDLILADYHLDDDVDGLDALAMLEAAFGSLPPAALITADNSAELVKRARALGYPILHKPAKPAALRALLVALARRQAITRQDRDGWRRFAP